MLEDAGRRMVAGQHDVGERLVVPHQNVEARAQPLDKIGFEQQRLDLGAGDDELHRRRLAHHPADAVGVEAAVGVVGHALLQAARLADVEHVAGGIHHAVDARRVGQPLDQRLDDLGPDLAVGVAGMRGPVDRREGQVDAGRGRGLRLFDDAASSSSVSSPAMKPAMSSAASASVALSRYVFFSGSFHHACHIRRLPGKMLAAVERDHLAGHRPRLPEIANRSAEFGERRAATRISPSTCASKSSASCRVLANVGPGPIALTRILGASACAIVCVAVHSADLDSV